MRQCMLFCLSFVFFLVPSVSLAADEAILNIISELLDEELASSEEASIYTELPPATDQNLGDTDQELEDAIARIHAMGITKFGTAETFMADNNIRRDEAATMFLRFAQHHDMLGTALVSNCTFPDLGAAHSDLTDEIMNACEAGLFQGSKGYFLPTASITNAQAITVMARILDGVKAETGKHWADNYYEVLQAAGLMDGLPMAAKYMTYSSKITRGDIAILLYRADSDI